MAEAIQEKKSFKTRKAVEISTSNLEWFYKEYGEGASISWFLNLLFTAAKDNQEKQTLMPIKMAELAAKQVEELNEELGFKEDKLELL